MEPAMNHRPRRLQGQAFYTTILVVSLFAVYSSFRSTIHPLEQRHGRNALAARALGAQDLECRLVHNAKDQCSFVKANCPDEEAGLASYLQLYYCSLHNAKPVAFIILVLWISMLFSTIGIAASDFLCINLSTIATVLGMSESLTGVTFLALGNGSPDVFSTFAAMSTNSGSLAVGELMGAAGFITAVVAGSMALVKPFQVARRSFVRDVGFFIVAASFSLVFLADGSLRLWECATMIGFYVFYVAFVVTWHWWVGRSRRIRRQEAAARLHHHIPETQELEISEFEDDEEARPAGERSSLIRGNSGESNPRLDLSETPAWTLQEIDDDDEARDRYLAELRSNMRISRRSRGERRNTMTPIRPSLVGALEFRSVLSALEKKGTGNTLSLRRYSDDPTAIIAQASDGQFSTSQPHLPLDSSLGNEEEQGLHPSNVSVTRSRAQSANDAVGLRLDTHFLDVPNSIPETAIYTSTTTPLEASDEHHRRGSKAAESGTFLTPVAPPQLFVSPPASSQGSLATALRAAEHHKQSSSDLLTPPPTSFHRPDYNDHHHHHQPSKSPAMSPRMSPQQNVPILQLPHPEHKHSALSNSFPMYTDSPLSSTPAHSRAPSIRLPAPSMSPESLGAQRYGDEEDEDEIPVYKWWPYSILPAPHIIMSTLFPTLYGWHRRGIWEKLLGLATAPSVFLLTITLPVVESSEESDLPDPDPGFFSPTNRSRSNTRTQLPADSPYLQAKTSRVDAPPHPHSPALSRQTSDFPKRADNHTDEVSSPKDWHRWLVFLQIFTAPLFVVIIVWANMDEVGGLKTLLLMVLGSLAFSLTCLLILLGTTSCDREPKYRPLFCFLGFAVAIAWISTIANEVVGVLKAIGVILGISDAILGLTIFAVGNSLGDLVADITVARLGYPVMALSACFGGPMLNILLGIGVSGMYMTMKGSTHKHHKHPNRPITYKPYEIEVSTTLMISGVTLLVTLVGLLIAVPLNGWRMDRKIGWGLIALWSLSTIGNVIVEVLGYGGEWELGS